VNGVGKLAESALGNAPNFLKFDLNFLIVAFVVFFIVVQVVILVDKIGPNILNTFV
jgi:large-conductance mechanosensitive channel